MSYWWDSESLILRSVEISSLTGSVSVSLPAYCTSWTSMIFLFQCRRCLLCTTDRDMTEVYKTADYSAFKQRLVRTPIVSWRLWSTLPLTSKRTHLTFAFRHLVSDSRATVPRDIRSRYAGDIADEDDDVSFLYGRVIGRQLVNNGRWHCDTAQHWRKRSRHW